MATGDFIGDAPESGGVVRGSDDDYCSAYPPDGHYYISHSVQAPPIRWVERCHSCGHINSRALREQLARGSFVVDAEIERSEELRPDRLGPGQDDVDTTLPNGEERPSRTF